MASQAQIFANQENAQKSHGATSQAGREASSKNHTIHGLRYSSGAFTLLEDEDPKKFQELADALNAEHNPQTATEQIMVRNMIHHEWLRARAVRLQDPYFKPTEEYTMPQKTFALFLRYQGMHERGFFKCLRELQNLRKENRKTEIGFERQRLAVAADQRAGETLELKKQSFELRKEIFQIRKNRVQAAAEAENTQKMAA